MIFYGGAVSARLVSLGLVTSGFTSDLITSGFTSGLASGLMTSGEITLDLDSSWGLIS